MDNLPEEMLQHVFRFLPLKQQARSAAVCSAWRKACEAVSPLWKQLALSSEDPVGVPSFLLWLEPRAAAVAELELDYTFLDTNPPSNLGPEPCAILTSVGRTLQTLTVSVSWIGDSKQVIFPGFALARAVVDHLPLCSD
ncbi:hypothetical protein WJX72_004737 [[Myrmecia] bisecta]|uniref:F-box domain-containing protein n=1 Tax=[Myrmecia] bisecta TaxID=41462 RepID=A0AAW1R609_9CHLO